MSARPAAPAATPFLHGAAAAHGAPLIADHLEVERHESVASPPRITLQLREPRRAAMPTFDLPRPQRQVLPTGEFLARLHSEKRRCERSSAALSMLIYRFEHATGPTPEAIERVLEALDESTREGDVVGRLDDGGLALLCTDTDSCGVRTVAGKIQARAGRFATHPLVATYPDLIFDRIAHGEAARVDSADPLGCEGSVATRRGYRAKRTLDIAVTLLLLLLAAPLMIAIAIVIRLESPGPVLYRQKRLGIGGVPFTFYKFRSMWTDVDDAIHRDFVLRLIGDGNGDNVEAPDTAAAAAPNPYKLKSDSRITRVGRLIRKTSADELPQLFNVLKGEMSLIGPRPPIPYEAASYKAWHLRRVLAMKPGITGLWQVEGRSRVTFNEMVRMDLQYVRDCSLLLDLKILLKTVRVVLRCDGAG